MKFHDLPKEQQAKANLRSAYPTVMITPDGRLVSIKTMAAALRVIRKNPEKEYRGWEWFATSGYSILANFRRGLDDRINLRGALKPCTK